MSAENTQAYPDPNEIFEVYDFSESQFIYWMEFQMKYSPATQGEHKKLFKGFVAIGERTIKYPQDLEEAEAVKKESAYWRDQRNPYIPPNKDARQIHSGVSPHPQNLKKGYIENMGNGVMRWHSGASLNTQSIRKTPEIWLELRGIKPIQQIQQEVHSTIYELTEHTWKSLVIDFPDFEAKRYPIETLEGLKYQVEFPLMEKSPKSVLLSGIEIWLSDHAVLSTESEYVFTRWQWYAFVEKFPELRKCAYNMTNSNRTLQKKFVRNYLKIKAQAQDDEQDTFDNSIEENIVYPAQEIKLDKWIKITSEEHLRRLPQTEDIYFMSNLEHIYSVIGRKEHLIQRFRKGEITHFMPVIFPKAKPVS